MLISLLKLFFILNIMLYLQDISYNDQLPDESGLVRRLPIHIYPTAYKLVLLARMESDHFQGLVEIDIVPLSVSRRIVLHQNGIRIIRGELFKSGSVSSNHLKDDLFQDEMDSFMDKKEGSTKNKISSISYDNDYQTVTLITEEDMNSNQILTLRLRYKAIYSEKLDGLYKMVYKNAAKERITIASTQLEPTSARKMFPCFDEPIYKATFSLTVIHDSNLFAISNAGLLDGFPKNLTQSISVSKFKPSLRMSTYLVSLSLIDFIHNKIVSSSGTTIRIFAADTDDKNLYYAANVASKALSFYEEFFNEKYPLDKLDIVSIPEFMSGAMENFGHLIFRPTNLIYDSERSAFDSKKQVMLVMCHELTHQWFGNLITMKWWSDIWLNEGFANMFEFYGADYLYPRFNMMNMHILHDWSQAIHYDSMNNSHSLSQSVQLHPMIDELFDPISYNKGSSILRMLQSVMGSNNFMKGVRNYINTYRYSNADSDDLWHSLSEFATEESKFTNTDLKLKTVMDLWTNQRSFPLVHVDLHPEAATISQISYLKAKMENKSKRDKIDPLELVFGWIVIIFRNLWIIPIHFIISSETPTVKFMWLTDKSQMVQLDKPNSWIKLNQGVNGYYITNYNDLGWENLVNVLKNNHLNLNDVDRAGLIHDALKLTCDGIISPIIFLQLIEYMNKELEYLPWAVLRAKYSCFFPFLKEKSIITAYKKYIWMKQKHLKNLTILEHHTSAEQVDIMQQYEVFIFALKHNFAIEERIKLRRVFKHMISHDLPGSVNPELRSLALMFGFKVNNERDFYMMWKQYLDSINDHDKRLLLKNLATFGEERFTKLNLENALNQSIVKIQDCPMFLIGIIRFTSVFEMAWNYIIANWEILSIRYGGNSEITDFLLNIVNIIEKEESITLVLNFIKTKNYPQELFSIKRIYEKVEERKQNNFHSWFTSHRCAVEKWFHRQQLYELPSTHYTTCNN